MRVHIKTGFDKERCLACNKAIKPGQQYTIEMTHPKSSGTSYKWRGRHFPSCEKPSMWEDGLIKEQTGYKSK